MLIIQADGFDLTEALKSHVETKVKKLKKFLDSDLLRVTLRIDSGENIVEIKTSKAFLKTTGDNMYSAINAAVETMSINLSRKKELLCD